MFEVGFTEIVLIFGIALLVLGPARLPKLAADLGRWAGRARAMARQLRTQLEQETRFDPLADSPPTAHSDRSETIHSPAWAPEPDNSRAAPAQLVTAAPTSATATTPENDPGSTLNISPEATAQPDTTVADEPKSG